MRHPVRWILAGTLLVPALLFVAANGLATSPDELPPPDPAMLIRMPDGRSEPLFRVIAGGSQAREDAGSDAHAGPAPEHIEAGAADSGETVGRLAARLLAERRGPDGEPLPPADGDIYGLAEYSLRRGDHEQALALFRSLPPGHPRYARAQRRIGWDIYTKAMDEPDRGLAFVNRSVMDDPGEGNAWQDALRVYAATLGFLVN
jgi:hypothetical protein